MSKTIQKVRSIEDLSEFDLQYLRDRMIDPYRYVDEDAPEDEDESTGITSDGTADNRGGQLPTDDETDEVPDDEGDADEGEGEDSDEEDVPYTEWTNDELREELKRRELKTTGKQSELIARLEANDAEQGDDTGA